MLGTEADEAWVHGESRLEMVKRNQRERRRLREQEAKKRKELREQRKQKYR